MLNVNKIKQDFPILSRKVNGKKLIYLDNAATSQKPKQVIDAISNYYLNHNANIHRGVHTLSDESTTIFENSKAKIAKFFGAKNHELIFVRNTTEAINGVAYGWGDKNIASGDVILVSVLDHHSNIVVWQELCKRKKAKLVFIDIDQNGEFDQDDFETKLKKFGNKIKLVALPHVSNVLGSVINIEKIVSILRSTNFKNIKTKILIDAAQSAPHMKINFSKLGVDFLAFSGHKMLGPMGIGGLLVREELLEANNEMSPWLFGGGMIAEVYKSYTNFSNDINERFTAGTPDVASVVGLAAACDYLEDLGMENVLQHDKKLVAYALEKLQKVKGLQIIGPKNMGQKIKGLETENLSSKNHERIGSVSFIYKNAHAHDVAQVLDSEGIAVRSGHHCAMPLHVSQNWIATTRASFQVYNSKEDIDALVKGLEKVREILF